MKKAKKGFGVSELFMIIAAVVIVTVVFSVINNLSTKVKSETVEMTNTGGTIDSAISSAAAIK